MTHSIDGRTATAAYPLPTASGGTAPVTISCTPPSGSVFPVGTSTVACTAVDAVQAVSGCTFTVTADPPPGSEVTMFVAFGDSITEGKLANGTIIPNSYPADLQQMLAARYTAQRFSVVNAGCGGETAAAKEGSPCGGGVVRLPGVLRATNPQVLLLMEGVNDLSSGDPLDIAPMTDALRTMVREAISRGVQVFLGTLLPERPGGSRTGALPLISAANDAIRQTAQAEGAVLVDLYQGFGGSPDPYIDVDGLHPNELGYQKMAQIFFDTIRAHFEGPNNLFMVQRPLPTGLWTRR